MTSLTLTELRRHASSMFTRVEQGETLVILRHGRSIARISPIVSQDDLKPSWQKSALQISAKGATLSAAILEERTL